MNDVCVQWIPALGAMCFGITIGWFSRFFTYRFKAFSPKVMGSLIAILVGGGIIKLLESDSCSKYGISFYMIGLPVGIAIYNVTAYLTGDTGGEGKVYYANLEEPENIVDEDKVN